MARKLLAGIAAATLAMAALSPVMAQQRWHDPGWRDRDIHRFHDHDFDRWQHGRWYHGAHGGRTGWWWIVGPTWYYYPQPIYPYPDPYVPPVVVAPAPNAWYYCPPRRAYYPYVAHCPVPWQVVPAQ